MKVVILGAGSTAGTFKGKLGVSGFVGRLHEVHPNWENDYPELKKAVRECKSGNLDKIWTHIDYAAKLRRSLGGRPAYPRVSGELRKSLLRAYSLNSEIAWLQDEARRGSSVFTLKTELSALGNGDALVSFNWDTVGESLARVLRIPPLVATGAPPLDYRNVNLIKPHGSLSWEDRGEKEHVKWEDGGKPLFEPMNVDSVHRGRYMQPLLLGAVPIKVELLKETQPNQDLYGVIADQWAAVVDSVARATELTVIGYGFPPEDGYGRFLFRQAATRRGDPSPPKISYYALDEPKHKSRMEKAFRYIFGKKAAVSFKGPVHGPTRSP